MGPQEVLVFSFIVLFLWKCLMYIGILILTELCIVFAEWASGCLSFSHFSNHINLLLHK